MDMLRKHLAAYMAVALGICALLLTLYLWGLPPFAGSVQTTDNAYVRGKVAMIGAQVAGSITDVLVQDYQRVQANQDLVHIDDRIFQSRLDQAEATLAVQKAALANSDQRRLSDEAHITAAVAQIASANAALKEAEARWSRTSSLIAKGVSSVKDVDESRAARDKAAAAVDQAKAALEVARQDLEMTRVNKRSLEAAVAGAEATRQLARIDLDNTRVRAPQDGRVGEIGARPGQYVTPGSQMLALVPDDVWVVANFKETQVRDMRVGQVATFKVDALGGRQYRGRIRSFSPAAASEFSVLKTDNATGNFTKIVQRVPVRIQIDAGQEDLTRLTAGLSVVASVDTTQKPENPGIK